MLAPSAALAGMLLAAGASAGGELLARVQSSSPESLREYRLPLPADLTGDWKLSPKAWRAEADFNGDLLPDTAVLMPKRRGPGYRLLVLLGAESSPRAVVLEDQPWPVQGFGLAVVPPGRYKTAAGKGYEAPASDPQEVILSLPALDRYHFESSSGYWYWAPESDGFKYVLVSD